jgi:UDP-N-acetylmuramoyl-tripeptide--D-alanyl-D-alanine ligase
MRTDSNDILLDAYNANPSSMESALTFFAGSDKENAKPSGLVAILGDMGELGSYASAAHDEILNRAIDSGVEVLTVGPLFSSSASTRASVKAFDNTSDLISFLKANPMVGRQVLLKGSRSIALEKAIIAL